MSVLAETIVEDRKRSLDSAAASRGDTGPTAFHQVLEEWFPGKEARGCRLTLQDKLLFIVRS